MAKVIVERPRIGSTMRGKANGYRRSLQGLDCVLLPRHEGMKRRHLSQRESLNEHLGPLRRSLDSQVGRPWNKVFAEMRERIDRSSAKNGDALR
jgi:hypothetical protein